MVAYAASEAKKVAESLLERINEVILFPLMTLMVSVAVLLFLYGAFEYIYNAGNDSARETGRRHMMYGIIGLLVMLSAYTILKIAAGTFGISA